MSECADGKYIECVYVTSPVLSWWGKSASRSKAKSDEKAIGRKLGMVCLEGNGISENPEPVDGLCWFPVEGTCRQTLVSRKKKEEKKATHTYLGSHWDTCPITSLGKGPKSATKDTIIININCKSEPIPQCLTLLRWLPR